MRTAAASRGRRRGRRRRSRRCAPTGRRWRPAGAAGLRARRRRGRRAEALREWRLAGDAVREAPARARRRRRLGRGRRRCAGRRWRSARARWRSSRRGRWSRSTSTPARDASPAAALKANLAAAAELPRQLRLRGLGGQVTVDFAPLARADRPRIERALAAALRDDGDRHDRARLDAARPPRAPAQARAAAARLKPNGPDGMTRRSPFPNGRGGAARSPGFRRRPKAGDPRQSARDRAPCGRCGNGRPPASYQRPPILTPDSVSARTVAGPLAARVQPPEFGRRQNPAAAAPAGGGRDRRVRRGGPVRIAADGPGGAPLRLRAHALRRTARPKQGFGFSGRASRAGPASIVREQ